MILSEWYVKRLPIGKVLESQEYWPIEVVPMTVDLVKLWHQSVQPIINDNYRKADDTDESKSLLPVRADVGWNWRVLLKFGWVQSELFGNTNVQPPTGLASGKCLITRSREGSIAPIGMLISVPRYVSNINGKEDTRNLVWFLSNAPREFYKQIAPNYAPPSYVSHGLLDTSIVSAEVEFASKESFLHASEAGGDKLLEFYESQCNMRRLPSEHPPITPARRFGLDRYFHLDGEKSREYSAKFNVLRSA